MGPKRAEKPVFRQLDKRPVELPLTGILHSGGRVNIRPDIGVAWWLADPCRHTAGRLQETGILVLRHRLTVRPPTSASAQCSEVEASATPTEHRLEPAI